MRRFKIIKLVLGIALFLVAVGIAGPKQEGEITARASERGQISEGNDTADGCAAVKPYSLGNTYEDALYSWGWQTESRVWNMIDTYADPEYFLCDLDKDILENMTDAEYRELRSAAQAAIKDAGAKTQYEKIVALTMYVANRVYYEYEQVNIYSTPYEVYKKKRAVCAGYAKLLKTLCISVGIPCMTLLHPNHASNAAYDSDQKRWLGVDASLCSNNRYNGGKWTKAPAYQWGIECHGTVICEVEGLVDRKYNSVYYKLTLDESDWKNIDGWKISISGAKKKAKKIKAVAEIDGIPVREVGNTAMRYNADSLQSVDLSETRIEKIDVNGFFECKKLTQILFPPTLTEIGYNSFGGCKKLEKIDFPSSLKRIEDRAFHTCTKLKEVDLSNTKISFIGAFAFYDCTSLKTVKLPTTVKDYGGSTFAMTWYRYKDVKTTVITNLPKKRLRLKGNVWTSRKVKVVSAYTVKFDGNGADAGTMQNELFGVGMKARLPSNKFKRGGYRFVGWSKKKNGKGKVYKNKAQVKNLAKKKKTVRLYACWKRI